MRVAVLTVGKARGPLAEPLAEYETRAARYFSFETREVREESSAGGRPAAQVRDEEGKRLLARLPEGHELVALHRGGRALSSEELAAYLDRAANNAVAGVAFAIGGAFGLSDELLKRATLLLSLSAMTLPHDLARLVLAEQIYRAGTILRGEPYHKCASR